MNGSKSNELGKSTNVNPLSCQLIPPTRYQVGDQNYFYIESALSGRRCFLRVREHSGLCDRGRREQMRLENVLSM